MSPLNIEVYNPEKNKWVKAAELKPTDPPGTISNNLPDGRREIIQFECEDSQSIIRRSKGGIDIDLSRTIRVVSPLQGCETLRILREGEIFEIEVRTDVSLEPKKVRFRQVLK